MSKRVVYGGWILGVTLLCCFALVTAGQKKASVGGASSILTRPVKVTSSEDKVKDALTAKELEGMKPPAGHTDGLLDCSNAIPIYSGQPVNGDNTTGPMNVSYYNCSGWQESGPEVVYVLTINGQWGGYVTGTLSDMSCDDDIFFLNACDENACIAYGDETFTTFCLYPGVYYIVVDHYCGPEGCPFDLTVTFTPIHPVLPGDYCEIALSIPSLPYTDTKNTCLFDNTCGNDAPDLFYTYDVQAPNELLDISLMGSDYDTYLWIWSECCVTYLAYNDDAHGTLQSEIIGCFQPGHIWIQVDGYDSDCGTAVLNVTSAGPVPPLPNDACVNAAPITVNDSNPTCASNLCVTGPECVELEYPDVWYTFTLDASETLWDAAVEWCGTTISGSSSPYLYSGGCCTDPLYANSYEWTTCPDGEITLHWLHLTAGQYWYPFNCSEQGDFCIRVTAVPSPPPPPNDECETATVIGALPYADTGNTASASYTCGDYTAPDVFYKYHVPESMPNGEYLTVSLMGSSYDTYLYVWSECCVTLLAYNDDFGGTLQSQLRGCFHGDIWIEVSGVSTACGDFILNVTSAGECPPPPENDMCSNATVLDCPATDVQVNLISATPDCAGLIGDYNNVWYAIYLDPSVAAEWDVHVSYCGTDPAIGTVGDNMQNDCNCDDYFSYTGFSSTYCPDIYWLPEWIYFDGMPAGWWYFPVYTDIGTYVVFSLTCEPRVPCVVECPEGATQEGERCPPDVPGVDNYNGGCNSSPPVFSHIECGETICGTGYYDTEVGFGDTDWYEATFDEPTHVTWKVVADFPVMAAIMTPQPDCSNFTYMDTLVAECDTAVLRQRCDASTYWFVVAPAGPESFYCKNYVATLECAASPNCQPPEEAFETGSGTPGPVGWSYTNSDNTCFWNGQQQDCIWGADWIWSDHCSGVQYPTNPKHWYHFQVSCQTTINIILHSHRPQVALTSCMPTLDGDEDMTVCCVGSSYHSGASDETITEVIPAGEYWVSVAMRNGCGPYRLTIISTDCELPVNLTTLEGTADDHMVTLTWTTASEQNNARFDVQRKTTTSDWTKVGTVNGAGNSQTATNYRFVDRSVVNGVAYTYRLVSYDLNGTVHEYDKTVEATPAAPIPTEYALYQNYPNPFNPQTSITYAVKDAGFVTLKVYNLIGQEVATLVSAKMEPGRYNATFSANDLPSGVYVYRLEVNNFTAQKKMVLLK
jgi:hypothetical protein